MEDQLEKALRELSPDTQIFKVLTHLNFKGASQPNQIADETGIPPGTVRPALRTLLEMGYVKQLEDGSYRSKIAFTAVFSDLCARREQ